MLTAPNSMLRRASTRLARIHITAGCGCGKTAALKPLLGRAHASTMTTADTSGARAMSVGITLRDMLKLSKHRLSGLVAFTAGAGYLCRADTEEDGSGGQASLNEAEKNNRYYRRLASTTVGTWLTAACANTLNQVYERNSDKLMQRTRVRPLPSGRVSVPLALAFAAVTGLSGLSILNHETNDIATGIAGANMILYAGVYTPLKAISTVNTWVGAVVGALPPLIGWAAGTRNNAEAVSELSDISKSGGAWSLASLLLLWQIPHFHALAVALRKDYAAAGLRMLAVSNPVANATWARYTAAMLLPIGPLMHISGVSSEPFVWSSTILSMWMFRETGKLCANPTCTVAARQVFRASILHLPLCLGLLLLHRVPHAQQEELRQQLLKPANRSTVDISEELRLHAPWEMMAPFPFLPVPRGPPAIVMDCSQRRQ